MYSGHLTDVANIAVGHKEDETGGTGVTVILAPEGSTAGVDVRGGAPGTRECVLLGPTYAVSEVHAIVLSGGSAFGLDSATGVMEALRDDGIGFDVGVGVVPIVPAAVLFDLTYKRADTWPDKPWEEPPMMRQAQATRGRAQSVPDAAPPWRRPWAPPTRKNPAWVAPLLP